MEIFQLIRRLLGDLSIYPTQTTKGSPLNFKNIIIFLFLGQFIILSMAYIVFEVNNLKDFSVAFYISSTTSFTTFIIFELIQKVFTTITSFEVLIGTRKLLMLIQFLLNRRKKTLSKRRKIIPFYAVFMVYF